MKIQELKKQYEQVVNEYIKVFCKKQDLHLEHWVGNNIGEIACFGDVFFFNFSDIVYDINSNQPEGLIIEWLYESIENEEKCINFYSYSRGLRYQDLDKSKVFSASHVCDMLPDEKEIYDLMYSDNKIASSNMAAGAKWMLNYIKRLLLKDN